MVWNDREKYLKSYHLYNIDESIEFVTQCGPDYVASLVDRIAHEGDGRFHNVPNFK